MRSLVALFAVLVAFAPMGGTGGDLVWTNQAGGSWLQAANWTPNQIPLAADRVLFTNAGSFVVVLSSNTTVDSLILGTAEGAQALLVGAGVRLTVANSIQLRGGAVLGAGTLVVADRLDWSGGRMVGPGITEIAAGAAVNVTSGVSDAPRLSGRRLDNAGTVNWLARSAAADSGAIVNNLTSGVFQIVTNAVLAGAWTFNNAGTFRRSGAAGGVTLGGVFNNSNVVEVLSGSLTLNGGGDHLGRFEISNPGTLNFVSTFPNTHRLGTSEIRGANVSFSGVTGPDSTNRLVQIEGAYAVTNRTAVGQGVTLSFSSAALVDDLGTNVSVLGGTLNLDVLAPVTISDLSLQSGRLTGSSDVTASRSLVWTNTTLHGTGILRATGDAVLDGANRLLGWTLDVGGLTSWRSGDLVTTNGSVVVCSVGGEFEVLSDGSLSLVGSEPSEFINRGTLRKTGGAHATSMASLFFNGGTVELQSGELVLPQGYVQTNGVTRLVGGNLTTPYVDLNGGILEGSGLITGSVTNAATVRLGQPSSPLVIGQDFVQTTAGTIEVNLPVFATGNNSLRLGGNADLLGRITNCLDCLPSGPTLQAETNFVFLTLTNPLGSILQNNLSLSFPADQITLGLGTRVDLRELSIQVLNTPPFFTSGSLRFTNIETVLFSQDIVALDRDVPTNVLHYALVSVTPGMSIGELDGRLTWVPEEAVGPGTNSFIVEVTDGGNPPLGARQTVTFVTLETNAAPIWTNTASLSVDEGTNRTFLLSDLVFDSDIPTNSALVFRLLSSVAGVALTNDALFVNATNENLGGTNLQVRISVTDSNLAAIGRDRSIAVTNTLVIDINEVNSQPVLTLVGKTNFVRGRTNLLSFRVSDTDRPINTFGFSLVSDSGTLSTNLSVGVTNATNFVVRWVPSNDESPATNLMTVSVTDTNPLALVNQSLTTSLSFAINVLDSNRGPTLVIRNTNSVATTNFSVSEGRPLAVVVDARDPDRDTLQFSLTATNLADRQPFADILIDPETGAITWVPTEAQGPGNYHVTVEVFDDGSPSFTNRQSFFVAVAEANQTPEITPVLSPPSFVEGVSNSLTILATDADLPAQVLTYVLRATNLLTGVQITNMAIDNLGVIRWIPTEAQGPSTNRVLVLVRDNANPGPLTNSIVLTNTVAEVNAAPVFLSPQPGSLFCTTTGALVVITNAFIDTDQPSNRFGFVTTFPVGSVTTNRFLTGTNYLVSTWTNTEPLLSTQRFTVTVFDANEFDSVNPTLSSTNELVVMTLATNPTAPVVQLVTNRVRLLEDHLSTFTNILVSDVDVGSIILYDLLSVVETNTQARVATLSMDSTNGAITWSPSATESPGTYRVDVVVTNLGCPIRVVATNFIIEVVATNHAPVVSFPVNLQVFTNTAGQELVLNVLVTDDTTSLSNLVFQLGNAPTNGFGLTNGVFTWTPTEAQVGTNSFSLQVTDTNAPPLSTTVEFSVNVVLGAVTPSPLPSLAAAGSELLRLNLTPGNTYDIQMSLEGPPFSQWTTVRTVNAGAGSVLLPVDTDRLATNGVLFYRAVVRPQR